MDNEKKPILSKSDKIQIAIAIIGTGAIAVGNLALYNRHLQKTNSLLAANLDKITDSLIEQIIQK